MKKTLATIACGISIFGFSQVEKDTLKSKKFVMDEVIISSGFNKIQSQTVMKVEHRTMSELSQKGTSTLIEGLATIPGISQISTGTSIGKPVIRGLSGSRVLVYSQGVRLENQQFGSEHGLGLNEAGIESVEIIKGPSSLLYGSDALGGIIYFNPEKFADPKRFNLDVNQKVFSNTLGSNSNLGIKYSGNNWKILARGAKDIHADYQMPDGRRVTNSRYTETDFKTAVGYSDARFSSTLRYNFNKLELGIPEEGIADQSTEYELERPLQNVSNHLLSSNNVIFFKNSKLDIDLGYIANDRAEYEDDPNARLHMKLNTSSYTAKYYFPKFGKIETVFGIQGMNQTNTNSGDDVLIPDATTNDFGVFGTANYVWNTNVIQAGLRFDNRNIVSKSHGDIGDIDYINPINKSFNAINASVGYKTNFNDNLIFRFNLSSGFRSPNLSELTSNGIHEETNRYEIGSNNLKNEQNIQSDLNLEFKSNYFEFFINGFYNNINNYIYSVKNGTVIDTKDVYAYVQNNAKLFGGEIGLHFHPHPLDWLHFETSFESVTGKLKNGNFLPLIPANKINNTIRIELKTAKWLENGFFSINVPVTLNQKNVSGFETSSNDYTLLNLGLGGKVKFYKIVFNVNINSNNLLNKTYIAHLSRLKSQEIPNIGRNVVFGINFNL